MLIKENPDGEDENPWGIKFATMFHMSNDSHLFKTREELENMGFELDGNIFCRGEETYLPLYEGKMIWHYDHRFAEFSPDAKGYGTVEATLEQHQDPNWEPMPRYWVREREVEENLSSKTYLLGFRRITNVTNERTFVSTFIPKNAVGDNLFLMKIHEDNLENLLLLIAVTCSFTYDFIFRNKMGGTNTNFYLVRQMSVLNPNNITNTVKKDMLGKVIHLIYTDNRTRPLAYYLGYNGAPFKWDPGERENLKAELDAIVAHLYGVTRDELDYILETFPIVKRKDIEKYGEYRTKDLILEYFDVYKNKFGDD